MNDLFEKPSRAGSDGDAPKAIGEFGIIHFGGKSQICAFVTSIIARVNYT